MGADPAAGAFRAGARQPLRIRQGTGGTISDRQYSELHEWREESRRSAARVVPHLVRLLHPQSAIDFGCGHGTWLLELIGAGVTDVLGVDGPWVDQSELLIPVSRFRSADLGEPFLPGRRYDLALSLEVAEHLPEQQAGVLVTSLVRAAPVVVFSAAIPGQGGVRHVNEQAPAYWVDKFSEHGYSAHDALRPLLWDDEEIAYYYRQNMLVFMSEDARSARPDIPATRPLEIVHPVRFKRALDHEPVPTTRELLRALPAAVRRSLAWRVERATAAIGAARRKTG